MIPMKKLYLIIISAILCTLIQPKSSAAQSDVALQGASSEKTASGYSETESDTLHLSLTEFMELVLIQNIEVAIEEFEITAAQAAVTAARVFENPELEIILPMFDRDEYRLMPRNIEFELEIPLELGRKHARRIQVARAEFDATQAGYQDFLRNLRSEIATLYVDVARQQRILEQMEDSKRQLEQLLTVTQQLFEAGEISEIEVIQTRLEERNFQAEYLDELAELSSLMMDVYVMMGGIPTQQVYFHDKLIAIPPQADITELARFALENRSDVILAEFQTRVSRAQLREARSGRIPDISILAGYHNEEGIQPMPGFRAVYAGVSIPLSFSSFNRGEVREAEAILNQSQLFIQHQRLMVSSEVDAAFKRLRHMEQKRALFSESIINDAQRVRDAVVYSYQRGEATLLEVLEAQRTLNEVYVNYYDALGDYAFAVIELSTVSGRWLLQFED